MNDFGGNIRTTTFIRVVLQQQLLVCALNSLSIGIYTILCHSLDQQHTEHPKWEQLHALSWDPQSRPRKTWRRPSWTCRPFCSYSYQQPRGLETQRLNNVQEQHNEQPRRYRQQQGRQRGWGCWPVWSCDTLSSIKTEIITKWTSKKSSNSK